MPKFAANLSMMFTEVPFLDRFEQAAKAGFAGVEFLFPYAFDPAELAERLKKHGLTLALINMPPGDWDAGERGMAVQVIAHLTKAFVVPVMYWHGVSASRASLAVLASSPDSGA